MTNKDGNIRMKYLIFTSLVCITLLSGCDSTGPADQSGTDGSNSLKLLSLSPQEGADGIDPNALVMARFSHPLDQRELVAGFALTDSDGNRVEGELTVDRESRQATFTPDHPLALDQTYRVTLDADVGLDQSHQANFRTRAGQWREDEPLASPTRFFPGDEMVHSSNDKGTTLAAWYQDDADTSALVASRYRLGEGWSEPQALSTPWAYHADNLTMDWAGDRRAVAAWYESDGLDRRLRAARFEGHQGWQPAQRVATVTGSQAITPRLMTRDDGRALLYWRHQETPRSVNLSQLTVGGDWQAIDPLTLAEEGNTLERVIVIPAHDGLARLVWVESSDEYNSQLRTAVLDDTGQLGEIKTHDYEASRGRIDLVAAEASGDRWTVVVIKVLNRTDYNYEALMYQGDTLLTDGPSTIHNIDTISYYRYPGDNTAFIRFDQKGEQVIPAYVDYDWLRGARYADNGDWLYSLDMSSDSDYRYPPQSVSMDAQGRLQVAWLYENRDNETQLYAATYNKGTAVEEHWITPPHENVDRLVAAYFHVGEPGQKIILGYWLNRDSRLVPWTRRFD